MIENKERLRRVVAESLIDRFYSVSHYASGEAQCNCCLATLDNSDPFVTTFDTFPHADDSCVKGRKYYLSILVHYVE